MSSPAAHAGPDDLRQIDLSIQGMTCRNLAWAFGCNRAALPAAALGFLNPVIASAAMTLFSAFVVWNSLRLRRFPLQAATRDGATAGGGQRRRNTSRARR